MDPNLLILILPLLAQVESNNDPHAVGDGGQAVGLLQIHPVMVRDVNRILGTKRYTLKDRLSPRRSGEMAVVYLSHYGRRAISKARTREAKLIILARQWNGGPRGHKKQATKCYGEKVRRLYRAGR